jgi:hypothetical protein
MRVEKNDAVRVGRSVVLDLLKAPNLRVTQVSRFIRRFGATKWSRARLGPNHQSSFHLVCMQHASTQEIKFRPPVHLPLE